MSSSAEGEYSGRIEMIHCAPTDIDKVCKVWIHAELELPSIEISPQHPENPENLLQHKHFYIEGQAIMRLTAGTAVAILAFTMARAGALPSPLADATGDLSSSQPPPVEPVSDFYHDVDGTEVEKRNPHEGEGGRGQDQDGGGGKGSFPFGNWPSGGQHKDGQGGKPTGGGGGNGGGQHQNGGHGWGGGNQRRDDDSTSAPAATGEDDDNQDYSGLACNCFYDVQETDAADLPTIRCGCFRENSTADGNDKDDGAGAGDGDGGGDSATHLSKRGKTGFIDPFHKWDWWQNQGSSDFDLTTGNPNVEVKDWKFGVWASLGGIKKRGEDGVKEDIKGYKARPKVPHALSGS